MDLEDAGSRAKLLIRDRDGKFPDLFDAILRDAGIEVVLSGVQMPRMNSIMERWMQTCRRELLDRTLIWNQHHLRHALREFEDFYNSHRPSTTPIGLTRESRMPARFVPRLCQSIHRRSRAWTYEDVHASAASCTSTTMPHDLRGWSFRQAQSHRSQPGHGCERTRKESNMRAPSQVGANRHGDSGSTLPLPRSHQVANEKQKKGRSRTALHLRRSIVRTCRDDRI
ncbi:integrase core domain-containing protein [Streptomyces sp. NPDC016845]|uniref:integrase core domain-containing protein n=1 Tax=Streptomyces sp. NPDC016845 TaxID=3364972 RepID=UPI00378BAD9B